MSTSNQTPPHRKPPEAGTTGGTGRAKRKKIQDEEMVISDKELSECDREKLHLLGHIQGTAGNVLFVSYPEGRIIAADAQIGSAIPWIAKRNADGDGSNDVKMKDAAALASNKEDDAAAAIPRRCSMDTSPAPSAAAAAAPVARREPVVSDSDEESQHNKEAAAAATQEMLGTKLSCWIPPKLHQDIWEAVKGMIETKSRRVFHFYSHDNSHHYAVTMHTASEDYSALGIEIESIDSAESSGDFYNSLISLGRIMELHADEKVLQTSCDSVFKILGKFDRGLVYRFNDDNSGEVVYEVKKETCQATSYDGMRFPSNDIPLAARKLYIKNGLRYIQDVYAEDVPILLEKKGDSVDLTHCRMRAVSKPHIMYLRNMGVDASMSIGIVVDNRLWGLLAFHRYSGPYKPSLHQRIACETVSSMLSVKMEAITRKAQSARVIELSNTLKQWEQEICVASNLRKYGKEILQALDADVMVAKLQDPNREDMEVVVIGDEAFAPMDKFWTAFEKQPNRQLRSLTTRKELEEMGLSDEDCAAAGVVFFRDVLVQVMLGRALRSRDVVWGGKPDEPKTRVNGFLTPRKSFERYMQRAKQEARSWSKTDLHVISSFMDKVIESSVMRMMTHLKKDIEEANLKYIDAYERIRDNSSWFAHMSHEIRTPFHGVMGCLNILQESGCDLPKEEVSDLVDTALSSGNHMIKLLNDILDIAKDKYLSHAITNVRTNYHTLASEATEGLKSLAYNNKITFSSEVFPLHQNVVIMTDKTKVVQVVSNLLNNAIKFATGGSVSVKFQLVDTMQESVEKWGQDATKYQGTIFTLQEHELFTSINDVKAKVAELSAPKNKQKWLLVSVSDSGCGMKAGELAEMLRPYTQSSSGSNRVFQGTGLGLFICTSLCRQLNGFIACSSTPKVGTVFHVGIPVGIPEDQSTPAPVEAAAQGIAPVPWPTEEIKLDGPIAVCDDNKVNVKILQRSLTSELKKRGLEVDVMTAHGGNEVVELYKAKRPRLLLIDYHMPVCDGIEATQRIRTFETENRMDPSYIVSYTADATDEAEQHILACGTNEIMTKPPPKGFLTSFVGRLKVDSEKK